MKILFIAPHPDDETIGAGGAIARHIALGDDVFWCIVTQGYAPPWPWKCYRELVSRSIVSKSFMGLRRYFVLTLLLS